MKASALGKKVVFGLLKCRCSLLFFLVLILGFCAVSCTKTENGDSAPLSSQYSILDKVVKKKKDELLHYLSMIEESVSSIREDGPLIDIFQQLNLVYNAYKNNSTVSSFDSNYENVLTEVYLNRFLFFENIYFINKDGDIFYSLIKNSITLENLFSGELAETTLAKSLKNDPDSSIIDFDVFPKLDPAAFFIHPVYKNSALLGWCVFELGADRLDTIFSSAKQLGKTGEVFLVNEQSAMLTNSYFSPELSPLKQHLSKENIIAKFNLGKGHLKITDYRGYQALTSFEVVSYHKVRWLIVAKKDLDEVLTQQYLKNPQDLYLKIRNNIQSRAIVPVEKISFPTSKNKVKVDQFKRTYTPGDVYTHGVSTCTAVLITLPGKFSYLAHISAYDVLYGGKETNIIGNIFDRIKKYEVPDYLLRDLRVYVVTPRIQFDRDILMGLVHEGLLLSQLFLATHPEANRASVYHDLERNQGLIKWDLENGASVVENLASLKDVGRYFAEIVNW